MRLTDGGISRELEYRRDYLHEERTWRQSLICVSLCISPTLLATNIDQFREAKAIQLSAIVESDHRNICTSISQVFILLIKRASNTADESLRRGNDNALKGF